MLFLILVEKISVGKVAKQDADRQRTRGPEEGTTKIVEFFVGFVLSYCVVSRPAHCSAGALSLMIRVHWACSAYDYQSFVLLKVILEVYEPTLVSYVVYDTILHGVGC